MALDPKDAKTYIDRGLAYAKQHHYQEALADFTQAIEFDTSNVQAYSHRGNVYANLQRYDEAVRDFTEVIRLDPTNAQAYFNLGGILAKQKGWSKALLCFEKAEQLGHPQGAQYADRVRRILSKEKQPLVDLTQTEAIPQTQVLEHPPTDRLTDERPTQKETTDNFVTPEEDKLLASEKRQERLVAWLQFPRRVVLLLTTFVLLLGLIRVLRAPFTMRAVESYPDEMRRQFIEQVDWSLSWHFRKPVADIIAERMPDTLLLLGTTLFLVWLLALAAILVAVQVHKLEERVGLPGSLLKGLGRLWVFSIGAMPVVCMGLLLLYIFAIQLQLLPSFGGGMGKQLIMPALVLAFLPATLTAQAVARKVTLPASKTEGRLWLIGLYKAMGVSLGQVGGILSVMVVVEILFTWPGLGILAFQAAENRDYPLLLGVLGTYAGIVLVGRLMSELFRWLERMERGSAPSPTLKSNPRYRTTRTIWVVVALAMLLVLLLGLAITGLVVDPPVQDLRNVNAPPSIDHPLGTNKLGRDVLTLLLLNGLRMLAPVALMAGVILIPGGLVGSLVGILASRRTLWAESIADLLLLLPDVLLLIPAVPGVMVVFSLVGSIGLKTGLVFAIVLLPRAVRFYQTLWLAVPKQRDRGRLGLIGLGALFLGSLFAGFWLVMALPGTQFALGLGEILFGGRAKIEMLVPIWICAFVLYTAADALIGFFDSKEAMARFNE